jgi:hypothetical protein
VKIEEGYFIADFLLNVRRHIQNHVPQNRKDLRLRFGEGGNIVGYTSQATKLLF